MHVKGTLEDHEWARSRYRELADAGAQKYVVVLADWFQETRHTYHGRIEENCPMDLTPRDVMLMLDEGGLRYGGNWQEGRRGEFWADVYTE